MVGRPGFYVVDFDDLEVLACQWCGLEVGTYRVVFNDEPRSEIVSDALVIGGGVRSGRAHKHRPADRLNSQESGEVLSTTHYQRGSVVY